MNARQTMQTSRNAYNASIDQTRRALRDGRLDPQQAQDAARAVRHLTRALGQARAYAARSAEEGSGTVTDYLKDAARRARMQHGRQQGAAQGHRGTGAGGYAA